MDEVLLPYLHATAESEKQNHLTDLILVHASPVVRRTLRQRLGFYVNSSGGNSRNQDAEDLYHEIITRIINLLQELDSSVKTDIHDFQRYVARLSTNACNDYLRGKSPARARLKNNLRELMVRHPKFAIWKSGDRLLCGLADWRGFSLTSMTITNAELTTLVSNRFPGKPVHRIPLSELILDLFSWVSMPMEIDALVNAVAVVLQIKDQIIEPLDDESRSYLSSRFADTTLRSETDLELQATLEKIWHTLKQLPANQRDSFCLGFEDYNGDDLFSLMVGIGLVTPLQLARELDRSLEDLMQLWARMPMDNAAIAVELEATRQQISKWRFHAVRALEKALTPRRTNSS